MRFLKIAVLVVLIIHFTGCGASHKVFETNSALDDMMQQKGFEMTMLSAEPQVTLAYTQVMNSGLMAPGNSVNRIDLNGSDYFIKVLGDSVSANLPYYGEQQMVRSYNGNVGIQFDGLAKNLEIIKDEEKQRYEVNFSVRSDSEHYTITLAISNTLSGAALVQSSHRNSIRYTGNAKAITDL